ncbi:MAG: EutN/CcmL family microcompartment protein [Cetobacterium sp.]|uniref:EutN/CcmL family microcompartment protein n=1 Tax=unclassified Cetobacterium TaxID=2630983 RepID=UPI00163B8CA6|nr:EutN/CcmL family microcompartment protein [Cetobacterium sp. 8H]MBC2851706.1 EutN/CcmL family microcompartment protein [Cetobacterium sp. 8H]
MVIGKIIGNVWATRKDENLNGLKFMIAQLDSGEKIVVCDYIGAGIGDLVLITRGSGARQVLQDSNIPIDAVTIGIVDGFEEGE